MATPSRDVAEAEAQDELSSLENTVQEIEIKMKNLEARYLGSSAGSHGSPFSPISGLRSRIEKLRCMPNDGSNGQVGAQSKLPAVPLPVFDGADLEDFLKQFERWLRLTGVQCAADCVKLDWLVQACAPKVKKIVEKLVEEKSSFVSILESMEQLFPKLENDLSLRSSLEKIPMLEMNLEPAKVQQLFIEIEDLFAKMSPNAMSDQERFILLTKKIHPKTFQEMRNDRHFKCRTENFKELKEALLEKSKEDWLERQLFPQRKMAIQTCIETNGSDMSSNPPPPRNGSPTMMPKGPPKQARKIGARAKERGKAKIKHKESPPGLAKARGRGKMRKNGSLHGFQSQFGASFATRKDITWMIVGPKSVLKKKWQSLPKIKMSPLKLLIRAKIREKEKPRHCIYFLVPRCFLMLRLVSGPSGQLLTQELQRRRLQSAWSIKKVFALLMPSPSKLEMVRLCFPMAVWCLLCNLVAKQFPRGHWWWTPQPLRLCLAWIS